MTKYLTITELIDPKVAQARKDYNVAEAEENLREALDELRDARARPLVTERKRQIEVQPGHPDYDKASETPDLKFFMGEFHWHNELYDCFIKPFPWTRLLKDGEFPPDMGEVTTK